MSNHVRRTAFLFLSGAALAAVAGDSLSTNYARATDVRIELNSNFALETTAMEMSVDGEVQEGRGGLPTTTETRHAVLLDRHLEQADGKPTKVRRKFETLKGKGETTMGDNTREFETDSELEGLVLELTSKDGEVAVELVEGSAPSEATALENHRLELALDAFLPASSDAGKAWDLDKSAVLRGLSLELASAYFPRPAPPEGAGGPGGGGGDRPRGGGRGGRGMSLLAQADWTGAAKWVDDAEHEGESCAVIELELSAKGELEERGGFGGRRGDAFNLYAPLEAAATTYEISLEGRVLFSKSKQLPVLLELKGSMNMEANMERESERGLFKMHSSQEGELEFNVKVSEVAREGA